VSRPGDRSTTSGRGPLILVTNLRRTYRDAAGDRAVLDGLDLQVGPGEWVAVAGPSGSGKSTLLHVLAGLDRGWKGSVEVAGLDLAAADERSRASLRAQRIGIVFQDYALLEDLSAVDNVALPRHLLGGERLAAARDRAIERLALVGLGPRSEVPVSTLSGGERQRVGLARALVNDPDILLCDEPTGNLDEETGRKVAQLLSSLHRERGLTVVTATHDRTLEDDADRVRWLWDGQLHDETRGS
jgi:predicted ABC-type transport system involved in lysophospholipase L1 biosynthesis ATPase subunit